MTSTDVVCILGPTASGKTGVAVALAHRLPVRVISMDSVQVYRGMDVGTAKPDAATRRAVPHHLVDIRDPAEPYSAAAFCRDARAEIDAAHAAGQWPLLVGGTMLYFRALAHGLAPLPEADAQTRRTIESEAAARGWPALHAELREIDAASAERIEPGDSQRIQRALEVYRVSGVPMSALWQQTEGQGDLRFRSWVICPPTRSELHERIERRFRAMVADGLVDEVRALRARGDLHPDLPAIRAVGYRQAWQYLEGALDADELLARGVIATRQLAKRQLTWLRRESGAEWLGPEEGDAAAARLERALAGAGD